VTEARRWADPGTAVGRVDDAALLARAAGSDVSAFDLLLGPRLDKLYRMALAIVRSESDARDAVQDASVLAWRELPRLRDRGSFDPWLSQILVNACRSLLRRRRRTSVREVDVDAPETGSHPGLSVRAEADDVGEVEAIRRAFGRLDPAMRSLIVLHYVEQRPLAEIAAAMGAPVGTIKWRLSNARAALDRALEVERR
jgi:RNA polymerase sigma-70 factor (ECF subfamily)